MRYNTIYLEVVHSIITSNILSKISEVRRQERGELRTKKRSVNASRKVKPRVKSRGLFSRVENNHMREK